MKFVDTGCPTVFRIENALSPVICDRIVAFLKHELGEHKDPHFPHPPYWATPPWQDNDTYDWTKMPSDYLFAKIESYIEYATYIVSSLYKEELHVHFSDLVLWRPGRLMTRHYDAIGTEYNLQRAYTSVTYLNDDFEGGTTYINSDGKDYISQPKKGTLVMYKSTEENHHGINPVISGLRFTLPIWFTRNFENRRIYDGR